MARRTPQSTSKLVNSKRDQSVKSESSDFSADRPAGGALRPIHGTILAPVVVVGATGTIGAALVRELVAAGRSVIAVAPDLGRLHALRDACAPETVTTLVSHIRSDADAAQLADGLRVLARPLAAVVVAFPHGRSAEVGVDRGRLLDEPGEVLADCLAQTVLAQHALARHLVPLLADSGRNAHYVIVGGPGSETPWAGYGHRSVAMAATRMLARVLHDETRSSGVRVQLLSIDAPVRSDSPGEHECPEWPSAGDVARGVVRMLDRSASDESIDEVVACGRAGGVRSRGFDKSPTRAPPAFTDVPTFLASLRNPPKTIPPQ